MNVRFVLMGLLVALGNAWGASPAGAQGQSRVIVVDDDGADCPSPDAHTLQEGVSLARPGDSVRVCAGRYAGGVVVATEDLTLRAKGAVTVDLGLTGATVGFELRATGVEVRGFEILGVSSFGAFGISTGAPGNRMIDNTIHGFTGPAASAVAVFFAGNELIERNTIFDNTFSIFANGTSGSAFRMNNVHDNDVGLFLVNSSANGVERNVSNNNAAAGQGDGIFLCGASTGNVIRNNRAHENGRDGIRLSPCEPGGVSPTGNLVRNNRMRDNGALGLGGVDARDESTGGGTAGTANTWKNNGCRTDSPDGLCTR